MKLTRREMLVAAAIAVPAVEGQQGDEITASLAALEKIVIPMDTEPAFAFKA